MCMAASSMCAMPLAPSVVCANERARHSASLAAWSRHGDTPSPGWLPGRRSCSPDGGVLRLFILRLSSRRRLGGCCCHDRSLAPICSSAACAPSLISGRSACVPAQQGLYPPDTAARCLCSAFESAWAYSCRVCGWSSTGRQSWRSRCWCTATTAAHSITSQCPGWSQACTSSGRL